MPDDEGMEVDPKIIDRSAKEFSKSIESGQLYKELRKKDSDKDDDQDNGNRKSK
jgi:hypothetical protein